MYVDIKQANFFTKLCVWKFKLWILSWTNRPCSSFLVPLFQNESSFKTFLMKMRLICMKMKLCVEQIWYKWFRTNWDLFWQRQNWDISEIAYSQSSKDEKDNARKNNTKEPEVLENFAQTRLGGEFWACDVITHKTYSDDKEFIISFMKCSIRMLIFSREIAIIYRFALCRCR